MGFKASFPLVVCLLILLGNVLAQVDNGRRPKNKVGSFTCDDQCLSWSHNSSRNDLADKLIAPRILGEIVDAFFIRHIPLVENQRLMHHGQDWSQYAAIWLIKDQLSDFNYAPPHPNNAQMPWVDNDYTCAPPRNGVNENYLLSRPKWWPSKNEAQRQRRGPLHAERILHNQVTTYDDLKAYVDAQRPITRVMMFSFKHPCRNCAELLVEILDQIKEVNGRQRALPCHLGWRAMWDQYDDNVNNQILQPGGITRVAKFGGLGQPLRL